MNMSKCYDRNVVSSGKKTEVGTVKYKKNLTLDDL